MTLFSLHNKRRNCKELLFPPPTPPQWKFQKWKGKNWLFIFVYFEKFKNKWLSNDCSIIYNIMYVYDRGKK